MTEEQLFLFREALKALSFSGTTIGDFAFQAGINPHTLYNYISGQRPSEKYYKHIIRCIKKHYPAAITIAEEQIGGTFNEISNNR